MKHRCFATNCFILMIVMTIGIGCLEEREADKSKHNERRFIVAVVGDGVPENRDPCPRATSINRAQGKAMWQGIFEAYHKSPRANYAHEIVEIVPYDDCGTAEEASRIAKKLQQDPRILAVIGHATSGTTRAAAEIYSQAGIPLLMPIATSPFAVFPYGHEKDLSRRLQNCFRLPPSDDRVQAPAVAYLVKKALSISTQSCFLLRDVSEDAAEYSGPLFKELEVLLADVLTDKREVNRKQFNMADVCRSIKAQKSEVVVFCGYGTTAKELLDALRDIYSKIEIKERPIVVLTDGCNTKELNLTGFKVYMTFPIKDIRLYQEGGREDFEILNQAISQGAEQSYQIYGYDALLLISHALEKCSSVGVSRRCLTSTLNKLQNFPGACFGYSFVGGENILSSYHIYYSDPDSVSPQFRWQNTIPPDDIVKYSTLKRGN